MLGYSLNSFRLANLSFSDTASPRLSRVVRMKMNAEDTGRILAEMEYKEALDAFNDKSKEKVQLITKLMELVSESERMRLKKLEDLSKNIETIHIAYAI